MGIFYTISYRKYLYVFIDVVIISTSYVIAYVVRFHPDYYSEIQLLKGTIIPILVLSYLFPFYFLQAYRIMWAYSNITDIYRVLAANCLGFLIFLSYLVLFHIPYSRIVILLSFFMIGGGSIIYRVIIRDYVNRREALTHTAFMIDNKSGDKCGEANGKRILIIGAGEAGRTLLHEFSRRRMGKSVIGFVDDNPFKTGKMLNGKKIFGTIESIHSIICENSIGEIVVAIPSASSEDINRIIDHIGRANSRIPVKVLPSIIEIVDNRPLISALRKIGVGDLIGREEVDVNSDVMNQEFRNKRIMVIGAGGSIGSEICRQLLKYRAKSLIMVGRGENSIYNLVKSINENVTFLEHKPELVYRIADIKDKNLMETIFRECKPDIVFHAAAHKHVPLMEFNAVEALQNNVIGTANILDLSVKYFVSRIVIISTDKAVHPTNIMGATKRMSEMVGLYYHRKYGLNVSIVRFGNVVGSRGSVIPLFQEQIEKGGPVTVTHPEVERFFMSIPEASLLVINASVLSKGGEIYILDMGKQYKILDIAEKLIRLYGFRVGIDIEIQFTGLRPGEKLYEELYYNNEKMISTENEKIFMLDNSNNNDFLVLIETFLNEGMGKFFDLNHREIRKAISDVVPEFNYSVVESDYTINRFVS